MFHKIKAVSVLPNLQLSVQFLEGITKIYDVKPLVTKWPLFKTLEESPEIFFTAKVDVGGYGIVWNDELDVSSETVYEDGKDVTKEYDDIDSVVLGYKIKVKRTIRLMTQEELARKIGIDQSDLSKIEKGTANPSLKTLSRIAKGLDGKLTFDI